MEAAGGTGQRGPFTSTPREPPPPLDPPKRTDSSTSLSSDSSGEDWLIKVCCPGARHRYRRPVELKKPRRTGFSHSLDKEDDFTETAGGMPLASYQTYPGVPRQESSDLQWLIRLRCPRAQMEERMPGLKQSLPEISTNLSNSPSKTLRSSQSEWANASENWLTQKNIFTAQASSAPGSPVSLCVLLPPFHPLLESPFPSDSSYFPSFLPPFPFSLLSASPSVSPPMMVLPSILLPPSVPPYFFHFLPPFPPYLHSPSLFFQSPFLQLFPREVANSTILPNFPISPLPPSSPPPAPQPSISSSQQPQPSQQPPDSRQISSSDFSAYHSHNPFFLPIPPPIQSHRRYQARQKNSDSAKYP
ncbi:uncharacterized protein LOC128339637 isoform X6 [Hemicordylus capensis]|uniref:uncharacterized protein LOC128339637 isoform X6 n=1 Tax=Hemicordylus capensis TaxID=884348 RepID=UPI002302051F|nr:uncharacterized protein LOC128339637 isoform X6 [Hemicordylus capensis]